MSTAMLVALIVLLALQVDTQLTVDDNDTGSCESSTSHEIVNLIRESWMDVKTACASNQQQSVAVDTSTLCKRLSLFRFFRLPCIATPVYNYQYSLDSSLIRLLNTV